MFGTQIISSRSTTIALCIFHFALDSLIAWLIKDWSIMDGCLLIHSKRYTNFVIFCFSFSLLFLTIDSTVPSSNSQQSKQSKIIQQVPNVQYMFDRCLCPCLLNSLETANDGNPIVYWILIKKRHKNFLSIQSVFTGLLNTRTLDRYEKKPPRRKRSI